MAVNPTVSALAYYPVKGCGAVAVDHSEVLVTGLTHDRDFTVVGSDGEAIWPGEVTRLAAVRARLLDAGAKLALTGPGAGDFALDVDPGGPELPVTVEKWPGFGIDQGREVAAWFSDLLGRPARLVRRPAAPPEPFDPTALLVISQSSLDTLNTRIRSRGSNPVPMNRFRPNIVIGGWPEPHTEDRVARMSVGAAEVAFGELAIRCAQTMVDQLAGTRAGPEPLRTLADYRREPSGGVSFGLKAAVLRPGEVRVGDEIVVTEWR